MRLARFADRPVRPGSILPMLGVCLIGLFGFVALAVDLGMLAVSRTQSQNGADVAALVGTRTLNNKDDVAFSNLPNAITALRATAVSNPHLSANFSNAQISKIEAGQYLYDPGSQTFQVSTWRDVTGGGAVAAPSGSWTAMRVTLNVAQPTYFMRVFGVTSMPSGARATAVYRPRDIAFVLDMTASMAYACKFANGSESMNPDTTVPTAGHYASNRDALVATSNVTVGGTGEVYSRNNYTMTTPAGPPIVRGFYFDPSNVNNPAALAYPLTTKADGSPNLLNAFHRWSPPETPGNSTNYIGQTYNWAGYNPTHKGNEASPKGPVPAPNSFATMTDQGGIAYAGDRWRRGDGKIDKTETSWSTSNNATRAAFHVAHLLGYTTGNTGNAPSGFTSDWSNFRDPVWERWGYDLDVAKYRSQRGSGGPIRDTTYLSNNGNNENNVRVPAADRFVGYSMGPGYWGKTFFIWPPDPRTPVGNPGDANYQAGDWRRRYFRDKSGGDLNPQTDNNTTNGTSVDGINEVIMNTSTGSSGQTLSLSSNQVNYPAILKWIKSGPQVLPPNLRAGRVLYYSSIPDDVTTSGQSGQALLDRGFWKSYIDFVLGTGSYTSSSNLYGPADNWSASPVAISTANLTTYRFSWESSASRPYMRYNASPRRPRLHMWFGPLSMIGFLTRAAPTNQPDNWLPGTCYEAQSWQLKAGMNSVLDDVKSNHPNDFAGMVMFASPQHNGVRVGMSQNFKRLKNALFYPRTLLNAIDGGDVTSEYRPFTNSSLGGYDEAEIPNSVGSTDPSTGLAYAYNVLSPSTISAAPAGTGGGRRGAQKIIIFETDGVPNSHRDLSFKSNGYNSYYTLGAAEGDDQGSTSVQNQSFNVIRQIVKQQAATATTGNNGEDSGLSLPNAPARVYPIAFGDLFDEELAPGAYFRGTAKSFLSQCGSLGGTGGLPDDQIITGPYLQRIDRLRNCLERIFQGGVSVVLVE